MEADYGNQARYLVKKPFAPLGLTSAAQNVLFQSLDKIRRLDSNKARSWALRNIPSSIREALLHQVLMMDEYTIVKFWSMLYSTQLYYIYIPFELSEKSRHTLMHYLGEAEMNVNESPNLGSVAKTLIFKVAGANSQTEIQMERIFLQKATYLTVFVHRKGASDDILEILGKSCPHLKEINITGSTKVSDEGIAKLFGYQNKEESSLNPVAKSLHFMKMRSTGVRVIGVRTLLHCAKNLQGIRCSSYDVLQALATQLKYLLNTGNDRKKMSLKYLDFSNCFAILSKYLFLLPDLIEVRIGSDAPPQMRQTSKRLLVDDSQMVDDANFTAVLRELPQMHALQTLVLKAFDQKYLGPLLKTGVGPRLRRLDLHYNNRYPGISLLSIGRYCPFLSELALCDSLISSDDPDEHSAFKKLFHHLSSLKMYRVSYSQPDDWEWVVRIAKNLRVLHMESSRSMSDSTFQSILSDNPLCHLEEFLVTGSGNRLSAKTVVRLTSQCSKLKWIGDLRDWNGISERERTTFLPQLLSREGWNSAKHEPKEDSSNPQEEGVMHFLSLSDTFDILSS